jgi:hypothetical protein
MLSPPDGGIEDAGGAWIVCCGEGIGTFSTCNPGGACGGAGSPGIGIGVLGEAIGASGAEGGPVICLGGGGNMPCGCGPDNASIIACSSDDGCWYASEALRGPGNASGLTSMLRPLNWSCQLGI